MDYESHVENIALYVLYNRDVLAGYLSEPYFFNRVSGQDSRGERSFCTFKGFAVDILLDMFLTSTFFGYGVPRYKKNITDYRNGSVYPIGFFPDNAEIAIRNGIQDLPIFPVAGVTVNPIGEGDLRVIVPQMFKRSCLKVLRTPESFEKYALEKGFLTPKRKKLKKRFLEVGDPNLKTIDDIFNPDESIE